MATIMRVIELDWWMLAVILLLKHVLFLARSIDITVNTGKMGVQRSFMLRERNTDLCSSYQL